ncbi:MAG: WD40 repeat domain-containing protein, partial [Myxococcales bacterium]|nr:WD40 repeat domain-containing protein [Myxococcales bacterium]
GALVDRGAHGLVVAHAFEDVPRWAVGARESTSALAYSPDGTMLAAVRKPNGYTLDEPIGTMVEVRAATDGALLHRLPGEVMTWRPDGDLLVGAEDGTLTRLDPISGAQTHHEVFPPAEMRSGAPRNMSHLRVLPDGRLLVARAGLDAIDVLDGETFAILASRGLFGLGDVSVSPDGTRLLVGLDEELHTLAIDRLEDGPLVPLATTWAPRLSIADDGTVATISTGGVATVLPADGADAIFALPIGNSGGAPFAVISPDGTRLVFAAPGSGLHRVELATGIPEGPLRGSPRRTGALAISPDGTLVAAAIDASRIGLWDLRVHEAPTLLPREPINENSAIFDHVRAIAFSPDGRWLAAAGGGFYASRVWALDGLAETQLQPKAGLLSFDPDSTTLLAMPYPNNTTTLVQYSVPDFARRDRALERAPVALAWTAAGRWTADGRATTLADPDTGEVIQTLPAARALAGTPNGATLALISPTGTLDLWCAN